MQNSSKDTFSVPSVDRETTYQSVVSDLTALIAHVHASMDLIESAISCERPFGNQEVAANLIVLDDISPSYMRANAALKSCSLDLSVALHFLKDIKASERDSLGFPLEAPRACLTVRA